VLAEGADGSSMTRTIPMEMVESGEVIVAYGQNGEMLRPENGYPLRLVVPDLYFWKSAKWIRRIAFHENDSPGFWESLGYHLHGDPWREQRYWSD